MLHGVSLSVPVGGVVAVVGPNRAVRSVHEFMQWMWVPLGLLHVGTLLLDKTARITPMDLVVPFQAPYGTLACAE